MGDNRKNGSSPASTSSTIVPYSLKSLQAIITATTMVNSSTGTASMTYMFPSIHHNPAVQLNQSTLDQFRWQLYSYVSYADRLRYAHHLATSTHAYQSYASLNATSNIGGQSTAVTSPYSRFDPCHACCLRGEDSKPQHSYIGLIGIAILSSAEKKLVLGGIYQHILDNYSYFRNRGAGWRNSVRHNLSLNDCFIKAGRSANGKGHFWAIHPANIEDFEKGDFRRRKAQSRVRKHLGLPVPQDDQSASPPPSIETSSKMSHVATALKQQSCLEMDNCAISGECVKTPFAKKIRQFDMDSILAPEHNAIDDQMSLLDKDNLTQLT